MQPCLIWGGSSSPSFSLGINEEQDQGLPDFFVRVWSIGKKEAPEHVRDAAPIFLSSCRGRRGRVVSLRQFCSNGKGTWKIKNKEDVRPQKKRRYRKMVLIFPLVVLISKSIRNGEREWSFCPRTFTHTFFNLLKKNYESTTAGSILPSMCVLHLTSWLMVQWMVAANHGCIVMKRNVEAIWKRCMKGSGTQVSRPFDQRRDIYLRLARIK